MAQRKLASSGIDFLLCQTIAMEFPLRGYFLIRQNLGDPRHGMAQINTPGEDNALRPSIPCLLPTLARLLPETSS